ncbi:MAG: prolipoprotein diacylglyceryl transferase, partial [bacterium]
MLALPFPAIDPALFTLGPISMFGMELGPFSLRWYALAYIAGLLLGRVYVNRMLLAEARWPGGKPPVPVEETENLLIWMTLGVVLGGRLGYVLFYSPHLLTDPASVFAMWKAGMSFHGGMLGVIVSVIIYAQRHKVSLLSLGDAIAIAAPIGLFFGRLANFING